MESYPTLGVHDFQKTDLNPLMVLSRDRKLTSERIEGYFSTRGSVCDCDHSGVGHGERHPSLGKLFSTIFHIGFHKLPVIDLL